MTAVSRDRWPLILGLWAAPASIAISEIFLSIATLVQLTRLARRQTRVRLPQCLWLLLIWAGLEVAVWLFSPEPAQGWSEIRHLLLVGAVLVALSGFEQANDLVWAWKGIFVTATASSVFLIGEFVYRFYLHREQIAAGGDAGFYLRSGGFLHHWMVYATVEITVVAALIAFWSAFPGQHRRWWPVALVHVVAVILSLTRMAWITCLLLLAINLVWRRSRWIWVLPVIPFLFYFAAPESIRSRLSKTADLTYYSNSERLQMLSVGWRMVSDHPLTGIGPGRVEGLYESYLKDGEAIPKYHGHLHNNVTQIAAQFGILVLLAAGAFVIVAFRDLIQARKKATGPDGRFLTETALLSLVGFIFAGLFEYTWGHSLGLIMITFAFVPALIPSKR